MQSAAALRQCLRDCDVEGVMRLHSQIMPHLPAPVSREHALASIHLARTQATWMELTARYYSHRWLIDHGYPSALPDALRPIAERVYPRTAAAVGIALKTRSEIFRPILGEVRGAMERAVLEANEDGRLMDSWYVKVRMAEAKTRAIRKLIGV